MPVLLARGEPDHVTGTDLLDRPVPAPNPPTASNYDKSLAEWMRVPRSTCARLKRDTGALNKSWVRCLKKWIDTDSPREPVKRPFAEGWDPPRFISISYLL